MAYKFLGTEYDKTELLPILKHNIDFLVETQKMTIQNLIELKENLEKVVDVFRNNGFSETEEEKALREKMQLETKEKSQTALAQFTEKRQNACVEFDSFVSSVERDIIAAKHSDTVVENLIKMIDDYISNKKFSLLLAAINGIDNYSQNPNYAHCYDCYISAFNRFAD